MWDGEFDFGMGKIKMMQLPEHPIMVQAELMGLEAGRKYELQVRSWGNEASACQLTGQKYNPLFDPSIIPVPVWTGWKYALPPHDYYGEIDPITADADGNATLTQQSFLQNLEGPQSLLGRSITLVKKPVLIEEKDKVIACCNIGRDVYHPPSENRGFATIPSYMQNRKSKPLSLLKNQPASATAP